MSAKVLEARGVTYRYGGGPPVLKGVSLGLGEDERVVILGPNGGGKSTLLHILATLIPPESGEVLFRGRAVGRRELVGRVGLLMQDPSNQVFMPRVEEDVAFGVRNRGFEEEDVKRRVREALKHLGIHHLKDRVPFSLSGGELKRVALAGVLAAGAEVLLLDEPTAGLDPRGERALLKVLKNLEHPMVITTHSPEVAAELATYVVVLKRKVVLEGKPEVVLTDRENLRKYALRPPYVTEAFLRAGIEDPPLTPREAEKMLRELRLRWSGG